MNVKAIDIVSAAATGAEKREHFLYFILTLLSYYPPDSVMDPGF